jgi:hypothetical protein
MFRSPQPAVLVSVDGRACVAVPADEVERAAATVDDIPRLHRRIRGALDGGTSLALSESEAVLLLAVVRHRLAAEPPKLAEALLAR